MEIIIENEILHVAVSTHGAELTGVVHKPTGAQLLWQADPAVWPRHAPILFPYAGRLKNGRYTHKGVTYEGGQHGFARDLEHTCLLYTSGGSGNVVRISTFCDRRAHCRRIFYLRGIVF